MASWTSFILGHLDQEWSSPWLQLGRIMGETPAEDWIGSCPSGPLVGQRNDSWSLVARSQQAWSLLSSISSFSRSRCRHFRSPTTKPICPMRRWERGQKPNRLIARGTIDQVNGTRYLQSRGAQALGKRAQVVYRPSSGRSHRATLCRRPRRTETCHQHSSRGKVAPP